MTGWIIGGNFCPSANILGIFPANQPTASIPVPSWVVIPKGWLTDGATWGSGICAAVVLGVGP